MRAAIPAYLRSLWNLTAPVHEIAASNAGQPFVSPLGIHLPKRAPDGADGRWFEAAAAHAAAHLVFSRHRFDPTSLGPIPQAILGVLEDARVEWLACRELPGLRRLWLPFHATDRSETPGFEELLSRLSRSLLDPDDVDSHPWVRKGRALFYLDASCQTLAMPQPSSLLRAASLLGNDIGQMRLQFNARLYRTAPCYRDDNSCLWDDDPRRTESVHEIASIPQGDTAQIGQAHAAPAAMFRYPEWDRLIQGYRADWCAVLDAPAPRVENAPVLTFRAQALPTGLSGSRIILNRQHEGDAFDLDALVASRTAQRVGQAPEPRVYLRHRRQPDRDATLLLIDVSASSGHAYQGSQTSILSIARMAALRCALAVQRPGGVCAIHSFCSNGRHAIHYERIKDFTEPLDDAAVARLMAVHSRLSTRLGAALRHAVHLLGAIRARTRRVLLLTDGQPRDIDIHDARYLLDDARQALGEAARRHVLVQCLALDRSALGPLRRAFGAGHVAHLASLAALPAACHALARSGLR